MKKPANLPEILERIGLSQADFGRLIGKDVTTVNRWCCGRMEVPRYALVAARAYVMLPAPARARLLEAP